MKSMISMKITPITRIIYKDRMRHLTKSKKDQTSAAQNNKWITHHRVLSVNVMVRNLNLIEM